MVSRRGWIKARLTLYHVRQQAWAIKTTPLQLIPAHTVAYSDDGPRHRCPFEIDHMEQISRMIVPMRIIAQQPLVQDPTRALLSYVGCPDASDSPAMLRRPSKQIIPEWLIELFREPVCARRDNCHVAGLWSGIRTRYVLLHREM